MRNVRRFPIAGVLTLLVWACAASPSGAATFTVATTSDTVDAAPGNGVCAPPSAGPPAPCSLRAAIQETNALPGNDVIVLPGGLYTLTRTGTADDTALNGDLDVTSTGQGLGQGLSIVGAGARTTRIAGTGTERVLDVVNVNVSASISGTTISGGFASGQGGGIENGGILTLVDSNVTGNLAALGGGVYTTGQATLERVTLDANRAVSVRTFGVGGGLYAAPGSTVAVTNSTISGNTAEGAGSEGGGIYFGGSSLSLASTTVAANLTDGKGGGIAFTPAITFTNTLVANNTAAGTPGNCSTVSGSINSSGSLESGSDCNLSTPGNIQQADPLLGPLQDNGGQTNTRALLTGSPAIDAGSASCPTGDQRGTVRPLGAACDIGAYETTPLVGPPPPPPGPGDPPAGGIPDPVLGVSFNVVPLRGVVLVGLPPATASAAGALERRARGSQKGVTFIPLTEARQLPVGSFLDTRRGVVGLTAATPTPGKTQFGRFNAGLFQVLQSRRRRAGGMTELRLKGSSFNRCRGRAAAATVGGANAAQLSRRTIRRLRANARGRFRTRGRHSAATVRGTIWVTADRCDGTLTTVRRGKVAVRDFRRKRTITLRAGKSYLARAPR